MNLRTMLKSIKFTQCLAPTAVDNDDFAGNTYVDTQGLAAILFLISTGDLAAAIGSTAEGTAPLIEECDTTGGTYTDVTSAALAAAIAGTKDNKLYAIAVDLTKSHKRYMQVQAPHAGDGSGTTSLIEVIAMGFPADQMPVSAAEMGLEEFIEA